MLQLDKRQAFLPRDDEKNYHIDKTAYKFKFTRRWFRQRNQVTFSTFLPDKFHHGERPVNMIQIGVFEGMDLIWCLQHILTHPKSRVLAIDPWAATRKLDQERMEAAYERAVHNLRPWRKKVEIVRDYSQEVLKDLLHDKAGAGKCNLVIIDGDHRANAVYEDATYSYELLKPTGWMLFDDYFNRTRKRKHVKEGVNRFLEDHEHDVELVWNHRHCVCFEKI